MASKSRWADTEEDTRLDAKLKEEKRRKKAEKAHRLAAEKQAQAEAAASKAAESHRHGDSLDPNTDDRPSKRPRLTPEPASTNQHDAPAKLVRYEPRGWRKCRSVDEYDKLNDIEEGTYGWVARATERATGKVVALKRLKLDPADRGGLPVTGLREMQILKDCRHRNIVAMEEVVVGADVTRPDKYVFPSVELSPTTWY